MKYLLHTECPTIKETKVKGGIPDIRRGIHVTIDINLLIVERLSIPCMECLYSVYGTPPTNFCGDGPYFFFNRL